MLDRLLKLEKMVGDLWNKHKEADLSRIPQQNPLIGGMIRAKVVDTMDPLKLGRVRVYSPILVDSAAQEDQLRWAYPIANLGGFDDSGGFWVPPAGSIVCLVFEYGNKSLPYYIGTTWTARREDEPKYGSTEFDCLWKSDRTQGYLDQDNSTVPNTTRFYPPWNEESYNNPNLTDDTQFYDDLDLQKKLCPPNIYGFKTPGRHIFKMTDGNPNCNLKNKRLEIMSARGNWLLFKDDPIHKAEWGHPSCCGGGDTSSCPDADVGDLLNGVCAGGPLESCIEEQGPPCTNPYFNRQEECRVPANCDLDQSGVQLESISKHKLVLDDKVEVPKTTKPDWQRDFDFGCTNLFKGKVKLESATKHKITINDEEDIPCNRDDKNGIFLKTACGTHIDLNDHTIGSGGSEDSCSTAEYAGEKRGIFMETTSMHSFTMNDNQNTVVSPPRDEYQGSPEAKAKNAYVQLRSGYGLVFRMDDGTDQQFTNQQYIELFCPQKDNAERQYHILRMQEAAEGPGLIFLRAGGRYIIETYDESAEQVGTDSHAADKILQVNGNYLIDLEKMYYNKNSMAIFKSDTYIILGAGQDCPPPNSAAQQAQESLSNAQSGASNPNGPCIFPVVVGKNPFVCPLPAMFGITGDEGVVHFTEKSLSDRVFASASKN